MRSVGAGFCVITVLTITMALCGNILLATVVRNECNVAFNEAVYQTGLEMYENEGHKGKEIKTEDEVKAVLEKYFRAFVSSRRTVNVEIKGFDSDGVVDAVGYVQYINLVGRTCTAGTRKTIVVEKDVHR